MGQSEPGSDGNKGYSAFHKAPTLLEPHHQIVEGVLLLCIEPVGVFYSLSRLFHQDTRWGREVLPLCREAVSLFYSLSQLGNSFRRSYPSTVKQSVYSTALAEWTLVRSSLSPLQRSSRCILYTPPPFFVSCGVPFIAIVP